MMELMGITMRDEDLNMNRVKEMMEDFNFAPRQQTDTSVDVVFTLHGTTIMFYYFVSKP